VSTEYVVAAKMSESQLKRFAKSQMWELGISDGSTYIQDADGNCIHYELANDHVSLTRYGMNSADDIVEALATHLDASAFDEHDDEYAEFFGFDDDEELGDGVD